MFIVERPPSSFVRLGRFVSKKLNYDDTFRYACCPRTSSGYIRGGDGYRAAIEGAGAAAQARHATVGRGRLARGSGATRWGVTTIGAALEQAARQGWYGRAATAEALWSTAQARRCAARRVDQGIEGRSNGRGLYQRAVDASAHWDADQGAFRRRVLAVFGLANAAAAGLERAAPHGTCARARRGGHPHPNRVCPRDPAAHAPGPPEGRPRYCNTASPGSNSR